MVFTDIKIRSLTGNSFQEFIPCIAKLRLEVLREYPYLYEGSLEEEKERLKKYANAPESIAIIAFEGSTVIGASMGIPLIYEKKEVQKTLIEKQFNPALIFHFDTSSLLKNYRGRGVGHHFFSLREAHVHTLKIFRYTCFFSLDLPENSSSKPPSDYISLHNFWRKRGYVHHPDMYQNRQWKDIGEENPTEKVFSCWLKELG